jgi:phospholipid-binding lipoprotein MlaA
MTAWRTAGAPCLTVRRSGVGDVMRCALVLTPVLSMLACAHVPTDPEARAEYELNNDPAEPTNRAIFAGNQFLDRHVLKPVALGYEEYVPGVIRTSLHNFTSNLGQPAVAVNDLLQGNVNRAWNTAQRFAVNTTVGGAGLFDVATDWNRPAHKADFGQTLGVWGVGPGPAVQLPVFGPSNARDSVGKVADLVTDPASFVPGGAAVAAVRSTSGAVGFVDTRANLLGTTDALQSTSLDYYATLRSVTAQRRAALVSEGKIGAVTDHRGDATPPAKSAQAVVGAGAD